MPSARSRNYLKNFAMLGVCLVIMGCARTADGPLDDEKNPHFVSGRDLAAARDYKRARRAFEKALEANPNSALAHYELGLLCEQQENDYVSAIYHYRSALRARPDSYPADNAKVRITSCKQELVKEELVAPVAQGMVRELDRLRQENAALRRQVETLTAAVAAATSPAVIPSHGRPRDREREREVSRPLGTRTDITPLPPRGGPGTHVVRAGETAFSIARQYRITVDALTIANPRLQVRRLVPGQRLNIPRS